MTNSEFDKQHLWHPYTSMINPLPCYEVESGDGVYIQLTDGRRLIDGMSSWWATIHGYNHPALNKALLEQAGKMSHVMFGGLTHAPAVELAKRLIQLLPNGLEHLFLADSGSIAVEVAMKMALQYWASQGRVERTKFLTIEGGYHGDTWHCMSVCDPVGGMHTLWNGRLPEQMFMPRPVTRFDDNWDPQGSDAVMLRAMVERNHEQLAAIMLEPIVQGAGGMYFYHPDYLKLARELCDEYDLLLICDEIATGFGRTGKLFASQWADIVPDIMCVGKALTGGYITLAATVANVRVAHGIEGSFMHGPTFMGNPLACSVACASLDLIIDHSPLERVGQIERIMKRELQAARALDSVADVRVLGSIGVVEMKKPVDLSVIQAQFVENGIWVRPFGKLVYVMPPYIITDEQLILLTRTMLKVLRACK